MISLAYGKYGNFIQFRIIQMNYVNLQLDLPVYYRNVECVILLLLPGNMFNKGQPGTSSLHNFHTFHQKFFQCCSVLFTVQYSVIQSNKCSVVLLSEDQSVSKEQGILKRTDLLSPADSKPTFVKDTVLYC